MSACGWCGAPKTHYMTHVCDGCTCSHVEVGIPGEPQMGTYLEAEWNPDCPVHLDETRHLGGIAQMMRTHPAGDIVTMLEVYLQHYQGHVPTTYRESAGAGWTGWFVGYCTHCDIAVGAGVETVRVDTGPDSYWAAQMAVEQLIERALA